MSVRVCFNNAACVFVAKLYILILVKIRTPSIPPPFFSLNAFWGQIKGAYGALFLPLAMTEGVLPKPSCIWVKPPHGCLLLACSIPSCVYVFSLYVQFFAILKLRASTKVCRLKCVLSAGWIWGVQALWSRPFEKDLPVILPCLPYASALLSTLCCCCMRWTPNASGMGGLGPKSRKPLVSELDARNHTGRFGVWFPKVHNIFFVWSSYVQWT